MKNTSNAKRFTGRGVFQYDRIIEMYINVYIAWAKKELNVSGYTHTHTHTPAKVVGWAGNSVGKGVGCSSLATWVSVLEPT